MALAEYVRVMLLLSVCSECMSDYYSVLGIPRTASEQEVRKAFRQLALKHHPDKNPSPNAQQIFTHLTQAYEVLSDQERRTLYDQEHHLDQCSKKEKQDLACKGGLDPNNNFLTFSLEDFLEMLQLEDDLFIAEEPNAAQEWQFTLWGEGHEEEESLPSMFGML